MSELRFGMQDSGRTVDVAPGDRLVIALPERASTGYRWTVDELPRGARIRDEHYEHATRAPIGSASLHVLVLEGAIGGTVRLCHARSWQGDEDALERFELTVKPAATPSPSAP